MSGEGAKIAVDVVKEVAESAAKTLAEGPPVEKSPTAQMTAESADMVNDMIVDGLHHIPVLKQVIDEARLGEKQVGDAAARTTRATKDMYKELNEGKNFKESLHESIRDNFGQEDIKDINHGMKQLKSLDYKPTDKEQAVTNKLVTRQHKVFEILKKYRDKGKASEEMSPELKKEMNKEINEAFAQTKDSPSFEDDLLKHKKNITKKIYDYPTKTSLIKKGTITQQQRENVFRAIEKDIQDHDTGVETTPYKSFRRKDGTQAKFSNISKKRLSNLINMDITEGKIFIDHDGKLKMKGDKESEFFGEINKGNMSTALDQLADIIANSERLPKETKELLLKDGSFKKLTTKQAKVDKGPLVIRGKQIMRGKLDFSDEAPDTITTRNTEQKTAFDELRNEIGVNLSDLPADEITNPKIGGYAEKIKSDEYVNKLFPEIEFDEKISKLTDDEVEKIDKIEGVRINEDNTVKNWKTLSETKKQAIKDANIQKLSSPEVNNYRKYIKHLERKKMRKEILTPDESGFLDHVKIKDNFTADDNELTIGERKIYDNFISRRRPSQPELGTVKQARAMFEPEKTQREQELTKQLEESRLKEEEKVKIKEQKEIEKREKFKEVEESEQKRLEKEDIPKQMKDTIIRKTTQGDALTKDEIDFLKKTDDPELEKIRSENPQLFTKEKTTSTTKIPVKQSESVWDFMSPLTFDDGSDVYIKLDDFDKTVSDEELSDVSTRLLDESPEELKEKGKEPVKSIIDHITDTKEKSIKFMNDVKERVDEKMKLPENIGKDAATVFKENKKEILGGALATAVGGAVIGEGVESEKDIKKIGEDIAEEQEEIKEGQEELTKEVKGDGDEIKKKLEDLGENGKNTAIAQIITNADDEKKDDDTNDNENKQINNALEDIEKQIDRLAL
ncbi:MAG: hypothetical protein JSW62_01465, partial [Thermoplasmatales archaeon]